MSDLSAGYGPLVRAALRTQSLRVLPWLLAVPALPAGSAAAYDWILPSARSRQDLDLTVRSNPAFKLIFGPLGDPSTPDGFTAWHSLTLGCFFTGLMALLVVVRASRGDEDSGQAELIASGMVGRGTRLLVAETLAALASAAVALGTLGATVAAGGTPGPSALLAAGFAACGLVFASVGAVAAQLGASASTARAIGLGVLGGSYMIRGWSDAGGAPTWTSWTTPIGWIEHTRPAVDNDWRVLCLPLVVAMAVALAAHALQRRRDFGLGVVAPRPGPAGGGVVATLPGFLWRLNRNALVTWLVALALLGAEFGNVATSIGTVIVANPDLAQIIAAGATSEREVTAGFVVVILTLMGIIASLPGIQVVTRLAAEEDAHRLEPVLAGGVGRVRTLALAVVLALLASAAGMLLGGAGLALVATAQGTSLTAPEMLWQSVAGIPAVWSLIALASAGVGQARRMAATGWAGAAAAFALTILGPLLRVDSRVLSISPFWHIPTVTAANPHWAATGVLALTTLGLLAVGFAGFRRRDVH